MSAQYRSQLDITSLSQALARNHSTVSIISTDSNVHTPKQPLTPRGYDSPMLQGSNGFTRFNNFSALSIATSDEEEGGPDDIWTQEDDKFLLDICHDQIDNPLKSPINLHGNTVTLPYGLVHKIIRQSIKIASRTERPFNHPVSQIRKRIHYLFALEQQQLQQSMPFRVGSADSFNIPKSAVYSTPPPSIPPRRINDNSPKSPDSQFSTIDSILGEEFDFSENNQMQNIGPQNSKDVYSDNSLNIMPPSPSSHTIYQSGVMIIPTSPYQHALQNANNNVISSRVSHNNKLETNITQPNAYTTNVAVTNSNGSLANNAVGNGGLNTNSTDIYRISNTSTPSPQRPTHKQSDSVQSLDNPFVFDSDKGKNLVRSKPSGKLNFNDIKVNQGYNMNDNYHFHLQQAQIEIPTNKVSDKKRGSLAMKRMP